MRSAVRVDNTPLRLLFLCLLMLGALLTLPFVVGLRSAPFNDRPIQDMEAQQSDYVFIGNSMLGSRIDPIYIAQASGHKAYKIEAGPSFVGTWYLWLKNLVAVAKIKPKKVFIFFTDEQLTTTQFWVTPRDAEKIESIRTFQEPVYDRIVSNKSSTLYQKITEHIHRFYARPHIQEPFRQNLSRLLMSIVSESSYERTRDEINSYLKTVGRRPAFDVIHDADFRPRDVPTRTTEEFSVALTNSFLDPMVKVAKDNNIPLCFFRIRRSPRQRREGDPTFQEYLRSLEAYFKENNVCYIDESGDTDITDDLYAAPYDDHIRAKAVYTAIFLRKYLQEKQP